MWLFSCVQVQGRDLEVPACHRRLTFAFGRLEKLTCSYKLKCCVPRISWLGTTGFLVIFLIPQP